MDDRTQFSEKGSLFGKTRIEGSHICQLSVRAIIALMVIFTICYMSLMAMPITEPLHTLGATVIGFLFGIGHQKMAQQRASHGVENTQQFVK